MAVLQALQGFNSGQIYSLDKESAILGRHPQCDIVLESAAVSRQHARIFQCEGKYYLEDLHSRNGTLLNGRPVESRQLLAEHDRVAICDQLLVFELQPPEITLPAPYLKKKPLTDDSVVMVDDEPVRPTSTVMSKLDVSVGSSGLRLEVNPQAKLKALLEISQNLGRALGLNDVLPKILDSLFKIFLQADRGFVVLRDRATGRLVPKAIKHRRGEEPEAIRISRTIVRNVMATREAMLSADASSDARFDTADSIVDFHIRSVMCAPLVTSDGEAVGVIQIDTLDPRKGFNREDLEVLASVASQAAFAVENAQLHEAALREQSLERELVVASEVLQGFLPAVSPRLADYAFFQYYEPAHQLGGDYYDYIPLSGGRLGVVVADVSGKGIPAALLMAKLSADTRYCLASAATPAAAVAQLNRVFYESGWEDRFVTLVLSVLDPAAREVTTVSAGHLPPLLRRGGVVRPVVGKDETYLPLGVERDEEYQQSVLRLEADDFFALYTDGITEAMNDREELYGARRLAEQVARAATDVDGLGRGILADVKRFVGSRPQSDDICLVCFGCRWG